MVISSARSPTDPNEEILHWLRCMELAKNVYKPPFRVSEPRHEMRYRTCTAHRWQEREMGCIVQSDDVHDMERKTRHVGSSMKMGYFSFDSTHLNYKTWPVRMYYRTTVYLCSNRVIQSYEFSRGNSQACCTSARRDMLRTLCRSGDLWARSLEAVKAD